jgi:hypothetical protein
MDAGIIIALAVYFIWVVPLRYRWKKYAVIMQIISWKKHDEWLNDWLWSIIGMVIAIAAYFIWHVILRIIW